MYNTTTMDQFSAVVVTRNRAAKAQKAIQSLSYFPLIAEIILIDNNSQIPIQVTIDKKEFKILRNSDTKGIAANRNIGISLAKSPHIIFLDDDSYIENINLEDMATFFSKHENVGIIAPKLTYPNGRKQESTRSFPTINALLWRGFMLYKIYTPAWYQHYVQPIPENTSTPTTIDWAIGACLLVRKEVFNKVGIFDEHFRTVYDDVDFCFRTKRAGFKIVYWPDSLVVHEYTRSSANLFSKAAVRHAASIIRFFWKCYKLK